MRVSALSLSACLVLVMAGERPSDPWLDAGLGSELRWSIGGSDVEDTRSMVQVLVERNAHQWRTTLVDADNEPVHRDWPWSLARVPDLDEVGFTSPDDNGEKDQWQLSDQPVACRRVVWQREIDRPAYGRGEGGTVSDTITLWVAEDPYTPPLVLRHAGQMVMAPRGTLEAIWLRENPGDRSRLRMAVTDASQDRRVGDQDLLVSEMTRELVKDYGVVGWTTKERSRIWLSDQVLGGLVAWRDESDPNEDADVSARRRKIRQLDLQGCRVQELRDPGAIRQRIQADDPTPVPAAWPQWSGWPLGSWSLRIHIQQGGTDAPLRGRRQFSQVLAVEQQGGLIEERRRLVAWTNDEPSLLLSRRPGRSYAEAGLVAMGRSAEWPDRYADEFSRAVDAGGAKDDGVVTSEDVASLSTVDALGEEHHCRIERYVADDGRQSIQFFIPEDPAMQQRLLANGLGWLSCVRRETTGRGGRSVLTLKCRALGLSEGDDTRAGALVELREEQVGSYKDDASGTLIVDPGVPGGVLGLYRWAKGSWNAWVTVAGTIDDPVPELDGRALDRLRPHVAINLPWSGRAEPEIGGWQPILMRIGTGADRIDRRLMLHYTGQNWFGIPRIAKYLQEDDGLVMVQDQLEPFILGLRGRGLQRESLPPRELTISGEVHSCPGVRWCSNEEDPVEQWDISVWHLPGLDLPPRIHLVGTVGFEVESSVVHLEGRIESGTVSVVLQRSLEERVHAWEGDIAMPSPAWRETWSNIIDIGKTGQQRRDAGATWLVSPTSELPMGIVREQMQSEGATELPGMMDRFFLLGEDPPVMPELPLLPRHAAYAKPGRNHPSWQVTTTPVRRATQGQSPSGSLLNNALDHADLGQLMGSLPQQLPLPRPIPACYRLLGTETGEVAWGDATVEAVVRKFGEALDFQQILVTTIADEGIPSLPLSLGDWSVWLPAGCIAAEVQLVHGVGPQSTTWRCRRRLAPVTESIEVLGRSWPCWRETIDCTVYDSISDEESPIGTLTRYHATERPGLILRYQSRRDYKNVSPILKTDRADSTLDLIDWTD